MRLSRQQCTITVSCPSLPTRTSTMTFPPGGALRRLVLALLCLSSFLVRPLSAQGDRGWYVALDGGRSDMHQDRAHGAGWALRTGRQMGTSGALVTEFGLQGGNADEGFIALEGGLALRLPRAAISPLVGF